MGEFSSTSGLKYPQEIVLTVADDATVDEYGKQITEGVGWTPVKVTYVSYFWLWDLWMPDTNPNIKIPNLFGATPLQFFCVLHYGCARM